MDIFNIETWVEFENGLRICFRVPDLTELAWATQATAQIRSLPGDSPELQRLANEEIPSRLAALAVNLELPGGATPPPAWKEQLGSSALLAGNDGVQMLGKVFFRTRLKADEPDPTRSE